MELDYNLFNILMLLGAFQGFILCAFIYTKRSVHLWATRFFIVFLFSIAFYNLIYAGLSMDLYRYYRPLHMFPLPYKWLIGLGFYFYLRYLIQPVSMPPHYKRQWYLWLPAILYFLLRSYWFGIAVKDNSYQITADVVNSGFFIYHEFAYLLFNAGLAWNLWSLAKQQQQQKQQLTTGNQKQLQWLLKFIKVFLGLTVGNLVLFAIDLWIHDGHESWFSFYPILLINSAYIYWIGFLGFTKANYLLTPLKVTETSSTNSDPELAQQIASRIIATERYTDPQFSLTQAAMLLDVSPKKLSQFINTVYGYNFSEFLNRQRTEKVKELLLDPTTNKYTLMSIAEQAGFKTKSAFNATFKRLTGVTPSAYKKQFKDNH